MAAGHRNAQNRVKAGIFSGRRHEKAPNRVETEDFHCHRHENPTDRVNTDVSLCLLAVSVDFAFQPFAYQIELRGLFQSGNCVEREIGFAAQEDGDVLLGAVDSLCQFLLDMNCLLFLTFPFPRLGQWDTYPFPDYVCTTALRRAVHPPYLSPLPPAAQFHALRRRIRREDRRQCRPLQPLLRLRLPLYPEAVLC